MHVLPPAVVRPGPRSLQDSLYDSQARRDFLRIDPSREPMPDATTLLKSSRLLLDNDLTKAPFEETNGMKLVRAVCLSKLLRETRGDAHRWAPRPQQGDSHRATRQERRAHATARRGARSNAMRCALRGRRSALRTGSGRSRQPLRTDRRCRHRCHICSATVSRAPY